MTHQTDTQTLRQSYTKETETGKVTKYCQADCHGPTPERAERQVASKTDTENQDQARLRSSGTARNMFASYSYLILVDCEEKPLKRPAVSTARSQLARYIFVARVHCQD